MLIVMRKFYELTLANRNELKSVGREEMKLVNARIVSRVFLLEEQEMGSELVLCVQLYVYGGQDM